MSSHPPSVRDRCPSTGTREAVTVLRAGRSPASGGGQRLMQWTRRSVPIRGSLTTQGSLLPHRLHEVKTHSRKFPGASRARKMGEARCCSRGWGLRLEEAVAPEWICHAHPSQPHWEGPACAPNTQRFRNASVRDRQHPSRAPRLLPPQQKGRPGPVEEGPHIRATNA